MEQHGVVCGKSHEAGRGQFLVLYTGHYITKSLSSTECTRAVLVSKHALRAGVDTL